MGSPKWCEPGAATPLAAAIAAAVHQAWVGPEEEAPKRFAEALRQALTPEEFERHELLALRLFHEQPAPPDGIEAPPPSAQLELCPRCVKLRKTPYTQPQNGRLKLQALRDPDWLRGRFEGGASVQSIADQLGCSYANIKRWADVHGLSMPRTQEVENFDARVGQMHRDGEAPGAIARELDTTVERVRESLRRQGLANQKKGHHYFEEAWWVERLRHRGWTKLRAARDAGIQPHAATYYVNRFGLSKITERNRKRGRGLKYPQLADPMYLTDLLRRHGDNYASAAEEVGCAATLVSHYARKVLGRKRKVDPDAPHSAPAWWREQLDAGRTTYELAEELGIKEKSVRERLRVLGWLDEAYRNNLVRERSRRDR